MDHLSELLNAAKGITATGRERVAQLADRIRALGDAVDLAALEQRGVDDFNGRYAQFTANTLPADQIGDFDLVADVIEAVRVVAAERAAAQQQPPAAAAQQPVAPAPAATPAVIADPPAAGTGTGTALAGDAPTAPPAEQPTAPAPAGQTPAAAPVATPAPAAPAGGETAVPDPNPSAAQGSGAVSATDRAPAADTTTSPPESGTAPAADDGNPGTSPPGTTPPGSGPAATGTTATVPPSTGEQTVNNDNQPAGAPEPLAAAATPPGGGGTALATRPNTRAAIRRTNGYHKPDAGNPLVAAAGEHAKPLRTYRMVAGAEVPEYPYNQPLTIDQLGDAAAARFAALPVGQEAHAPVKANVARVYRDFDESLQLHGDNRDIALIDRISDERSLPGGSLVEATMRQYRALENTNQPVALTAAAQAPSIIDDIWCTPSMTDYTLCAPLATRAGMIDLPTTGIPFRGGIRYPVWTQFPEQQADASRNGWHGHAIPYPEANPLPGNSLDNPRYFRAGDPAANPPVPAGAGYPKKCIEGPCVTWVEKRASLSYLCITSDIIRDRTFPEGIARFVSDVLIGHDHFMNGTYISYIAAHADALPAFDVQDGPGAIGSVSLAVADRIGLLVSWFRSRYQMADDATLEMIMPDWFREYLKRDLEKKNNRPYGAVSNAEIAMIFAAYISRVQWVRDWQQLPDGPMLNGRVMPPTEWPDTIDILAYPAGSWVLSQGNILQLGVMYDFQLLQENRYSALFTEDAWMLLNRCNRTFKLTLTNLCANGAVGPMRDACPPAAVGGLALDAASLSLAGVDEPITVGQARQAGAHRSTKTGTELDVTNEVDWGTSNPEVAIVDPFGLIEAVAPGTVTISATLGGQRVQAPLVVNNAGDGTDTPADTGSAANGPATADSGDGKGQGTNRTATGTTGDTSGTNTGTSGTGTSDKGDTAASGDTKPAQAKPASTKNPPTKRTTSGTGDGS